MTGRERFDAVLSFGATDKGFNHELGLWGQTVDRWRGEGMPVDVCLGSLIGGSEFFGIDHIGYLPLRVVEMMPEFEEEVLSEDERYLVKRYADGHVTRALKAGIAHGTRSSMDQYLSWAVEDRAGFAEVRRRYDAASPARYPEWRTDLYRCLAGRDYPLALTHNACFGLYSMLRRLMGTEKACTVFYDDPTLAEEMLDFFTDYLLEVLARALDGLTVDYFNYFEDFAFKTGPLIGPNLVQRFLLPRYRRINDFLRGHGIRHILLDSDGNTEVLIPLLLEAGITCHWPLERAAGMEPLRLRARYGHDLALMGGIDKRALAGGRAAIDAELDGFVPRLLDDGGYVPCVDHTVPPDVSYADFMYYLERKQRLLGY
ncbi:MAG: uroporphyrinogen decarboxylase family protein [Anaerolineae bacterium]